MNIPDIPQLKPFDTQTKDNVLTITIRKEFDFGSLHQDWSHTIIALNPGPFSGVKIDMSQCSLVSSTFFAGLMQLHFHYTNPDLPAITLVQPDYRVVRNLSVMKMDKLFTIIDR